MIRIPDGVSCITFVLLCAGCLEEEAPSTVETEAETETEPTPELDSIDEDDCVATDEVCDGIDNDCDGFIDEALEMFDWYVDDDGDGYGSGEALSRCEEELAGYTREDGDCDDTNAARSPIRVEVCDELDNDCDDIIDEDLPELWTVADDEGGLSESEYDADGKLLFAQWDADMDGVFDFYGWYTYDAEGRLIASQYDNDGDLVIDESSLSVYDKEGRLIRHSSDDDGDGVMDSLRETEWFDDDRPLVDRQDYDGDGVWDNTTVWRFDELGQEIFKAADSDGDGEWNYDIERTWTVFGNWDTVVSMFTPGRLDTQVYTYDDAEQLILMEEDDRTDGIVDYWNIYVWSDDGTEVTTDYWRRGGMVPSLRSVERFDEAGREIYRSIDRGADDVIDEIRETGYDEWGNEVSVMLDEDGDGQTDIIRGSRYDESGRLLMSRYDRDGDGIWEFNYESIDDE